MIFKKMQDENTEEIIEIYKFDEYTAKDLIEILDKNYDITNTFHLYNKNFTQNGMAKFKFLSLNKEEKKEYLVDKIKSRKKFYFYLDTNDKDSWILLEIKFEEYFCFTEKGQFDTVCYYGDLSYYYKELNLENRIKELQKQNIRVISVINLSSLINTNDDNIIKDVLEKYQLENLEYPDQEKFNLIKLNGYKKDKSKYNEIDWVGYNWLVVLFENETKKYHIQVYKHLENLKYEY